MDCISWGGVGGGVKIFIPILIRWQLLFFENINLLARKIISLTKGFYAIPVQNGGLSNFTGCRNLMVDNSDCILSFNSLHTCELHFWFSSKRSSDNIF